MAAERVQVDPFDLEELIRHCFDLDESEDVDEYLSQRAQDDSAFDLCHELVMRLLPLVMIARSPLTDKVYQGFAKREGQARIALVKMEVTDG